MALTYTKIKQVCTECGGPITICPQRGFLWCGHCYGTVIYKKAGTLRLTQDGVEERWTREDHGAHHVSLDRSYGLGRSVGNSVKDRLRNLQQGMYR